MDFFCNFDQETDIFQFNLQTKGFLFLLFAYIYVVKKDLFCLFVLIFTYKSGRKV